jgi:hypothetical protein
MSTESVNGRISSETDMAEERPRAKSEGGDGVERLQKSDNGQSGAL